MIKVTDLNRVENIVRRTILHLYLYCVNRAKSLQPTLASFLQKKRSCVQAMDKLWKKNSGYRA